MPRIDQREFEISVIQSHRRKNGPIVRRVKQSEFVKCASSTSMPPDVKPGLFYAFVKILFVAFFGGRLLSSKLLQNRLYKGVIIENEIVEFPIVRGHYMNLHTISIK